MKMEDIQSDEVEQPQQPTENVPNVNVEIPPLKVEEMAPEEAIFKVNALTSKQENDIREVRKSYDDFWENIKFRKGWETPHVDKSKVAPYLDEAAEIVVRIRSFLDSKNPIFKIRMRDGSAREFLWDVQHSDESDQNKLFEDPNNFIRQMVHWTFKDANGYVEGLTEEEIDKLIQTYKQNKIDDGNYHHKLINSWKRTQEAVNNLLNSESFKQTKSLRESQHFKLNVSGIRTLITHLEGIKHEVEQLRLRNEPDSINSLSTSNEETQQEQRNYPTIQLPLSSNVSETNSDSNGSDYEDVSDGDGEGDKENENKDKSQTRVDKIEEQQQDQTQHTPTSTPTQTETNQENNNNDSNNNLKPESELKSESQEMKVESQPKIDEPEELNVSMNEENLAETSENQTTATPTAETTQNSESEFKKDPSVQKIEVIASEVDQLRPEIKSLHDVADKLQYEELAQNTIEGKKLVEQLQKKCLTYVEGLMKDLLLLDEIVASQEIRPLRKAQVSNIQKMIDEVDNINRKLRGFAETLNEKYAQEEEIRMEKERLQKRIDEENSIEENKKLHQQQKQQQKVESVSSAPQLDWKLLKIKPKFDVSETPRAYIIASYIPGMNSDSINVQLGKNGKTITLEGVREPTKEEMINLRKRLITGLQHRKLSQLDDVIDPYTETQMMMKLGAGRFGKFSESYQLPESVDSSNIEANYERGVLKITIPKIEKQRYNPRGHTRGGAENYGSRNPYHQNASNFPNSFLNDGDFWW